MWLSSKRGIRRYLDPSSVLARASQRERGQMAASPWVAWRLREHGEEQESAPKHQDEEKGRERPPTPGPQGLRGIRRKIVIALIQV